MSSYFDYYSNNIKNYYPEDTEIIQGTCFCMCPQDEIRLREKENLVHVLEVVGEERRLVKSYSRSAADSNMAMSHLLRPMKVLKTTIEYLLFEVCKRSDVPLYIVYDFINDRLRAVRQDMTIQRLTAEECAQLLEPMVRFYVYFGYRLYGLPIKSFDPVLNKKYLLECIKWFLSSCDQLTKLHNGTFDKLSSSMCRLQIITDKKLGYNYSLMESLYILCNLDDIHPLLRYIILPDDVKRNKKLQLAYKVAVSNLKGNFVQLSKLLNKLCPLSYCAVCLHLPIIQRNGLQVLCHAYNSKCLTLPSSALKKWLCFSSDWEARGVCQHYGLSVVGSDVRFDKGNFKTDSPLHSPKIQLLQDGSLNLDLEYIFTYRDH